MDEQRVVFQEEKYNAITRRKDPRIGLLSRMIIALGLAADNEQAQSILLYVAVFALVLSCFVFFYVTPKEKPLSYPDAQTTTP